MSRWFRTFGLANAAALAKVRQYYPDVSGVVFVKPDGPGDIPVPPPVLVVRNRGKHNPGSGDYYCSHVYPAGGFCGWIVGNSAYLTYLSECRVDDDPLPGYVQTCSFDGSVINTLIYNAGAGSNYNRHLYLLHEEGVYDYSNWSLYMRGWHSLDEMEAIALAKEPSRGQGRSKGRWNNSGSGLIPPPTFIDHHLNDIIATGSLPNLSAYMNAAAVDAYESLPAIQTNNIANLLQIYTGLKSIVELRNVARSGQRVISGVGSLADAWLGYRYSYSTTKSDIEELSMYADRMRALRHTPSVTGHGMYTAVVGDDNYIFRCSVRVPTTDLGDIYSTAEQFGLALDGYNAWDLIPYSFIVDWFLHIGDILESARSRRYAVRLHPSAVWFSTTHEFTNSAGSHQCDYVRWRAPNVFIDSTHAASLLSHGSSSQSTWVKRGADAIALLS